MLRLMSSPTNRKPGMMITEILMAIDNFSFVGDINGFMPGANAIIKIYLIIESQGIGNLLIYIYW